MPERTHYQILGVPETASIEEIKKQYRAMARKFHPDVNTGQEAARQFSIIAEAYRVLSDSEARRLYDANRALQSRPIGTSSRPSGSSPAPSTPRPSAAALEADRLVQQAQTAHSRGRHIEARTLAEQALRYNRKNALAWEILGDICRAQNRIDDALHNYSMAIQLEPRNASLHQKIERIARRTPSAGSTSNGYTPNTPPRAAAAANLFDNTMRPGGFGAMPAERRPLLQVLVGFFGFFGAFLVLLFTGMFAKELSSPAHSLPIVTTWTWPFVGALSVTGVLLGATMTITGTIRRIEEDLILTPTETTRATPLGIFVMALGSIFFWGAAALHLLVSFTQEALTPSLLRLYGIVSVMVLLFATVWSDTSGGFIQTLLFGGNVIFVSLIIGWLLGDFFRPD